MAAQVEHASLNTSMLLHFESCFSLVLPFVSELCLLVGGLVGWDGMWAIPY
jgi:uncharacterized Tic20 family protein